MPPKRASKMSLAELGSKFGADMNAGALPTHSEGKDFGKGRGKGLRDFDDSRAELSDWRGGGGKGGGDDRGGKGGFRGRDRDEPPSRSDTGDWFAKDRDSGPRFGGGGDRGGPRGGGDRDGGFRGGGGRGADNSESNKDSDWRGGLGRRGDDDRDERRGGFGSGFGGPRRGDDDRDRDGGGASQRPRLQLKPRSKPLPGEDGPERDEDEKEKEGSEDEGKDEEKQEAGPRKYIPPGERKRQEEEQKKKEDDRRRKDEDRRRRDDEDRRRESKDKDDGFEQVAARRGSASGGGSGGGAGGSGGGYVPPALRKQQEEQKRKEAEREAKLRAEEERKAKQEEEAREAEKARKREMKERKEAEARARKEELLSKRPQKKGAETKKVVVDEAKLEAFGGKCEAAVNDGKPDKLVKEASSIFDDQDFRSVTPVGRLLAPLLRWCRRKEDEEVVGQVKKFAPVLKSLIGKSEVHRFKVKVLCEAQRLVHEMGLPRLSPASALIEVFFDALYQAEVIEEDYFHMWTQHDDDTPGKINAMFQLNHFIDWLRNPEAFNKDPKDDEEEEEDEDEEEADEEEAESEQSDIEANVPKRATARPLRA